MIGKRIAVVLASVSALAVGCVSTGDTNITARKTAEGSLCARYCDAAKSAGCTVTANCESDCKAEVLAAEKCRVQADNYYNCAVGGTLTCGDDGQAQSAGCTTQLNIWKDCASGQPGAQCAADTDCAACCKAGYDTAAFVYDTYVLDCACGADVCATACAQTCKNDEPQTSECTTCIEGALAAGGACASAEDTCAKDASCAPFLSCQKQCR